MRKHSFGKQRVKHAHNNTLTLLLRNIFNEQHCKLVNISFMVAKLGNMFRKQNLCPGTKNVFDLRQKHFPFSEEQNLFLQHMIPARLN